MIPTSADASDTCKSLKDVSGLYSTPEIEAFINFCQKGQGRFGGCTFLCGKAVSGCGVSRVGSKPSQSDLMAERFHVLALTALVPMQHGTQSRATVKTAPTPR